MSFVTAGEEWRWGQRLGPRKELGELLTSAVLKASAFEFDHSALVCAGLAAPARSGTVLSNFAESVNPVSGAGVAWRGGRSERRRRKGHSGIHGECRAHFECGEAEG